MGNKVAKSVRKNKNVIFFKYILDTKKYYRKKILANLQLQDIIKESIVSKDLEILKELIIKEFPQFTNKLYKYLIIY